MNINLEYAEALTELDMLLQVFDEKITKKIPEKFKIFIKNNKSTSYIPKFDVSKKINKNDLKLKTRVLLALIYRNYLCDEDEKKEYDLLLTFNEDKYQKDLREKYNPDDIFKKKEKIPQNTEEINNLPIKVKNENFYKKLINFIRKIFHI